MLSPEYKEQLSKLHEKEDFGTTSDMYAGIVVNLLKDWKPRTTLDYGSGKQAIKPYIKDSIYIPYDPAIPGCDAVPFPAEFVICTDVLEHVEPEFLEKVLDDLKRVTKRVGFFVVHTGKALNHLPDGRNAHLIQEPPEWWLPEIMKRWKLLSFQRWPNGFMVVVENDLRNAKK